MDAPAIPDGAPNYLGVTTALALELASQLTEPSEVFARHGIAEEDQLKLLQDPVFQAMVKEAKLEWESDQNVNDRIRLKAQMALEELLLPTFTLAKDPRVPPPARLDAAKMFERLSGVSKQAEDAGGGGPKFVLSINVNADEPKSIEGTVIDQDG